ncbi:hypothetical protein B0J17DRAFT_716483 [Rhizoctonia solani]|nr:hypothetical protein B0J17DRAFT_716483 [Rhizoctonia solani]
MPQNRETPKGLNILCIDGGGIRGLSSLIVLQEIMLRVESANGGRQVHPYEHFDMIAGTGTGGVSACMLGRLRMPVQTAIEEYIKMMGRVFTDKKLVGSTVYKGTKLEEALKAMVRGATGSEDEKICESQENGRCKAVVFAMAKHNLNAGLPVMFRSYAVASNPAPDCAIWQALYASMAHPELFRGIDIVGTSGPQSFVGGELGCSNPIAHVLSEVKRVYPDRQVACVISIGAGHARTIQVPDSGWRRMLLRAQDVVVMKDMATDSERVAEEMAVRFQDTKDVYFRFNVDQGMQDMKAGSWERRHKVVAHTSSYLQKNETHQKLECTVRSSLERLEKVPTGHTDGHILDVSAKRPTMLKRCPAPTPIYTGREMENTQVAACIAGSKDERRVCVVHGLGGVGKTQLALNVIERTRDEWKHVIFVDASSRGSIEQTLEEFAILRSIGSTYEATLGWLEGNHERWLVVFDNADDPSTNIRHYIPGGRHGSILITTRLPDLAGIAKGPGAICRLSSMKQEDGLALLIKATRMGDQNPSNDEIKAAEALLQDFGYLALAIIHAGAFIAHIPGMTLTKYRSLFLSHQEDMLEQYRRLPATAKLDDYGETVYTTWMLCYQQLHSDSRLLLALMSYLHYDWIFEGMFEQAALKMKEYDNIIPPTELELLAQSHVKQYLSTFMSSDGGWDSLRFGTVIAELTSYSLVDYDRMNCAYSIHVLVQDWARSVISQPHDQAIECTAALLSLSTGWNQNAQPQEYKCKLAPHVSSVLKHSPHVGPSHADWFAVVYQEAGQWRLAEGLAGESVEVCRKVHGQEHEYTLSRISRLAQVYGSLGRIDEARELFVRVLEARRWLLGEEHPYTLTSMSNLADEAKELFVRVLEAHRRLLGEEHPDTLTSMNNLASTYSALGRLDEAKELEVRVLEAHRRLLGEEHPDTLTSMANLAGTYSDLGRLDEAKELEVRVLEARRRLLGEEHPHTLTSMSNLAAHRRLLGEEHPDTLTSMNNLASTYSALGRLDEAKELEVRVLEAHRRLLGEEHPDTLTSMANLAGTYSDLGRLDEAKELEVRVLEARRRLLGEEHPHTLTSMNNLAGTYSALGRTDEAKELEVRVLEARRRLLGEEHPDTLTSMANLAGTYSALGRLDEAKELEVRVLEAHRRLLGEEHPDTLMSMNNLAYTYSPLGRFREAEELYHAVISGAERVLGNNHPHTCLYRNNLEKHQVQGT